MDLKDQEEDTNPPAQAIPMPNGEPLLSAVAREDLLLDFGHQLRNELNAIVSAASMLSATATTSEQRELSAIVETGANRVARLLDDILDAAVIQSGDFELALHPFDVRASVESCLGTVVEEAGGKSLELSFRAEPDVPSVIIGDSRRIEQVMLALLHGGIERTERGGIDVQLSCQARGDLMELRFRVRDTGRGIAARILRSGLGDDIGGEAQLDVPGDALAIVSLSICRRLVEMMDGELRVEQGGVEKGPDAGTTFEFTILTQVMHTPVAVTQRTLEGMRVLVIAADATERRVLALQAELWGAPATVANVADALALVQEGQPFDLAIVEHRRPAIDGLALSIALRSQRSPAQLPIVLVTAATPGPEEAGAADSGVVQATLTKPVPPHKLHDVMAQVGTHQEVEPEPHPEVAPGVLKVLVAEDNPLNQNTLRRLVGKLGHHVDVVSNGREAVAAVAREQYDAVLMDVLMPEMDGLQAAEAIVRRWPRGTRPRLVALTAMAAPGDKDRCLRAGFDDYMSKPIHLDELSETLSAATGWRATPKGM
ncbi:MAG: response regulator [Chloroflexi bacterium]|nr:MAG: response regulator [Chloroflexota bacterium]